MATQNEVKDDPKYKVCLDHGFVGLIDSMGNDSSIVQAARVSYGQGTKKVSEDRGLIRYLLRHKHTTPFEMIHLKFHCKMPIFVARQWVRHRTASINEYSARYSIMTDEFYIPELEHIQPQAKDNKQGRSGLLNDEDRIQARNEIIKSAEDSYSRYQLLLGDREDSNTIFSDDYDGIARELARGVLTVFNYTEWYWSINLHNLFHFLRLRMDLHAQYEIRVYADAMYEIIKPLFPDACEAFEDYILGGVELTRMEVEALREMLKMGTNKDNILTAMPWSLERKGEIKGRELKEFKDKFKMD